MAPVMSLCRASTRPGQSLLSSRGSRSSQPRSVAAHATPDERCNAAIATLSAASLLVGAAAPALAADMTVAPSPAAVVAGQPSSSKMSPGVAAPSVLFDAADLNADVRDTASGYRDPAIATPQDKVADKLPSTSDLPDLSDPNKLDVGGVTADAGKTFSKGMFGKDSSSALPSNPLAALADLNADVRDAADSYRDPAIATPQDKVADSLSSGSVSTPDLGVSDAGNKLSSAADDAATKAKSLFGSGSSSALPANPLAAVADLNADVRDLATDYRDPAGAVQLDAASDALKKAKSQAGGSDVGSDIAGAASDAKDKAKGLLKGKGISALPANPLAAVADQNADVRDLATDYRDPAGAVQLDAASDALKKAKSQVGGSDVGPDIAGAASDAKDKAKGLLKGKGISALPANPLAAVADQNADVRNDATDYRDPFISTLQDAAPDILEAAKSKTSTTNFGDKVGSAADDAKDKAKGLLKGKGISALPANPLAAVADQNADVRDAASGYRDPAGAVQLDAASDALKKAKSQAGGSDVGSDIAGAASDAKDKAKGLLKGKGISALPANPLAAVADQNADVRDAASGYRDPAGAVQLDAASDALKKAKSQAGGSDVGSDIAGAASDAKDKAKSLLKGKGISALPANPLTAVADLNRDVRGDSEDYRDPAGAVQQDNAAGAVKSALKGSGPSISTPSLGKANKQVKKAGQKLSKQVGVTNKVQSGKPVYPISGAKLNKPLVQDSVGRSFN
ncbi:hypothetical protein OEZ85_007894 [Tetradesmus obliquus]|uniref:Uncharacterized protein n=1 Tax=Tetradesmus obliquus TaxID=3088 RepID=A0ABY8THM2_TETOB|nr:hypothetical protein OEZ85_007894 [Tetradesmus obliquus]